MKRILLLNQNEFDYDQISKGNFVDEHLSDFEKNTLRFCKVWLNGERFFELQTSGSTGTPKKIVVTRQQMEASARLTIKNLGLSPGDTAFVCLDTAYVGGKMMLVRGFVGYMKMIIVSPGSNPLKSLNSNSHFHFAAMIPMQLKNSLEGGPPQVNLLNQAKAIIIGGGAIDSQLEETLQIIKAPVYSTYGMTETVSHIALKKMNEPDKTEHFTVFEEVEIGQDERGCLTIEGPVTNNERIMTNDLVKLINKKAFQWIGRIDNVINSGGIKINAEELEHQIRNSSADLLNKRRFIVAGIKDATLGEKVILLIEGKPLSNDLNYSLVERLKKDLPVFHSPKNIFYLPEFLETKTGKIMRDLTVAALNNQKE